MLSGAKQAPVLSTGEEAAVPVEAVDLCEQQQQQQQTKINFNVGVQR